MKPPPDRARREPAAAQRSPCRLLGRPPCSILPAVRRPAAPMPKLSESAWRRTLSRHVRAGHRTLSVPSRVYSVKYVEILRLRAAEQCSGRTARSTSTCSSMRPIWRASTKQHNLRPSHPSTRCPHAAMGVVPGKAGSLDQRPPNATVAIPNDDTTPVASAARAAAGGRLITLDASVDRRESMG